MIPKARSAQSRRPGAHATSGLADAFEAVARAFVRDRQVSYGGGKGFGSGALKVDGRIFAMLSSKGQFVVKLPADRVAALVGDGTGQHFDAGGRKQMKEWLAITGRRKLWVTLAKEARQFVGNK